MEERVEHYLKAKGCEYLLGFVPSTMGYVLFCGISAALLVSFVVIFGGSMPLTLLSFVGGLFFPHLVLRLSDASDNDAMLRDLQKLFEMLKIEIHAGVFVVDALEECSHYITHKRLKQGVEELLSEIYACKDVKEVLDDFGEKFDNPHIDALVIILKQSLESGSMVNQLEAAFEQVKDVERAIHIKLEHRCERKVALIQVFFMLGILAIAIFCSLMEFQGVFAGWE